MFWNLVGHDWATSILAQHIKTDSVKHAYLFCGLDGIGRRSLALRFAQALSCPNARETGEPCLSCSSCQRMARMQHPDLFVISVPENRKEISIEQVRTLQHDLSLAPYEAPCRIGLLLDFQNASAEAQNSMLKTLEEPTSRVVLLVTASRPEDLLPTISSRCEVILLRPTSAEEISIALEKQTGISKTDADKLARLSNGCYGQAVTMQQNPEQVTKVNALIDGLLKSMTQPLRDRFAYAEELAPRKPTTRENLQDVFKVWISFWRDALIISSRAYAPLIHSEYETVLRSLVSQVPLSEIHAQLARLEDGFDQLDKNVNTRLLTEVIVLGLPRLHKPLQSPL